MERMFEGRILDALDIEAVFVAEDEEEAKRLGIDLVRSFGLKDEIGRAHV